MSVKASHPYPELLLDSQLYSLSLKNSSLSPICAAYELLGVQPSTQGFFIYQALKKLDFSSTNSQQLTTASQLVLDAHVHFQTHPGLLTKV